MSGSNPFSPLSEAEVERLFAAIDRSSWLGRRDEAIFRLLLMTGIKPKDVLALRLCDVDVQPGLRQALGNYLVENPLITNQPPDGCLFPPSAREFRLNTETIVSGRPLLLKNLCDAVQAYARQAGLAKGRATASNLRCTGAYRLLQSGASPNDACRFLRVYSSRGKRDALRYLRKPLPPESQFPPDAPPVIPLKRGRRHCKPFNKYAIYSSDVAQYFHLDQLGFSYNSPKHIPVEDLAYIRDELCNWLDESYKLPANSPSEEAANALISLQIGVAITKVAVRLKDHLYKERTGIDREKEYRNWRARQRYQRKREYKQWLDYLIACCDTKLGRDILFFHWRHGDLDYLLPEHLQRCQFPPEWE